MVLPLLTTKDEVWLFPGTLLSVFVCVFMSCVCVCVYDVCVCVYDVCGERLL